MVGMRAAEEEASEELAEGSSRRHGQVPEQKASNAELRTSQHSHHASRHAG